MRKLLLATLCVGLPALVASCSSDSGGGTGETGGNSSASTSSSQGGSSGKASSSSSTPSGGSSTPASSASGGSSSAAGGSSKASSSGGKTSTGGSNTATSNGGSTGTGGTGTAGASGGGTKSTGGTGTGTGTGGTAAGGSTGTGGTAAGGSTGTGGSTASGAAVPSKGCGLKDGAKTLTTGGSSIANGLPTSTRLKIKDREYIIDIPADYDASNPYRLIFSWHQAYGSDTGNAVGQYPANQGPNFDAKNYAYFGLQRESTTAKQPAIFVAPGGIGNFPWDYARDVVLFDDLLALVTANLCIDESRVFTTGFSFGAMMSYGLSIGRPTKLRAAITMAAANYNLPNGPTATNAAPFAYFGITGMSDGQCPWGDTSRGGKACVFQHAKDNGCTVPTDIPLAKVGSKNHVCYDFEGCKAGYPVKVCTFDGNHTPSAVADGSSGGDDGLKTFVPPLAWKFITQF